MSDSGWVQGFHDFFVQYLRKYYTYRFPDVVEVRNIDQDIEYAGCESCSYEYIVLTFDYRDEGNDVWRSGSIDSTFADIMEAAARA
jgi:hypothetical protein